MGPGIHNFIFTCWFIWKWRNKRIFDLSFQNTSNAFQLITQYLLEWINATKKTSIDSPPSVHLFSWQKPSCGYVKLNVDGTRSSNGQIGAGESSETMHNGIWLYGFTVSLGTLVTGKFCKLKLGLCSQVYRLLMI